MPAVEKKNKVLFEGSYSYLQNEQEYSQEIFSLRSDLMNKTYIFDSEILTSVSTGEFLKIKCLYELTHNFFPVRAKVEKFLGENHVKELYEANHKDQVLTYSFESEGKIQTTQRTAAGKYHIATPAFCTSALYTIQKKGNTLSRNQYQMIASNNYWEFESEPIDEFVYLEYKSMEGNSLLLNDQKLSCTMIHLFQNDSTAKSQEQPTICYLSDHYSIPYKLISPDGVTIQVNYLKKITDPSENTKGLF